MGTAATTRGGNRASFWAWPGPADVYFIALCAAVWLVFTLIFRKSEFAMAAATAAAICASPAWQASRGVNGRWNAFGAWVLRIGGLITACWLWRAAASAPRGAAAVAVFVVIYAVCEAAAARRVPPAQPRHRT
jgi:hypothetical protein